jgi:arginyl-tRNA synthetase
MIRVKKQLEKEILARLEGKYPLPEGGLEINYTPKVSMGDLALTFPFHLSKSLKNSPREAAQETAPLLSSIPGVERVEIAGPGYINLFLDRKMFFLERLNARNETRLRPEEKKIIIEHTNINPNKAAHIGHLRNAVLGDTLGRCLKYKGETVEIQNYIDDTGVQVVDVVFGFLEIEKKSLEDIEKRAGKFDYFCWDLYTRVAAYLAENPDSSARKAEILKRIEGGDNLEADVARLVSRRIIKAHLQTMKRIDITYDVLPCESSILRLKFWDRAFALLKEKRAIEWMENGPNKGCWIMRLEDEKDKEKVIVRSNGTVTYVGKDIAYQLWKFGLLGQDFNYRPFIQEGKKTIWISSVSTEGTPPSFGKGSLVYNVIDTRQSYLQKIVVQGLKALKYISQAEKSIHYSYEMVALSPKSLKELGFEINQADKDRNFLEVSGRKGLGIKADDLLDRLETKACLEVAKRNPDLSDEQIAAIANDIAVGALRYFMLKYARNSLIVFDFEEALAFEGETGPYLQYSLVRIGSIFRKLKEREGVTPEDLLTSLNGKKVELGFLSDPERDDFWDVILYASRFEEEILHSIQSLEFSHLAKFSFNLCQKFNAYYHKYSVLAENDKNLRQVRILTIFYIRYVLEQTLSLMGIPIPDRM